MNMRATAIIFILFSVVMLFCHCGRQEPSSAKAPTLVDEAFPDQEGWNSSVTSTKNGKLEAVVEYGHMMRYAKKNRILFDQGVRVDFFDVDGRKRSQLTADSGELNEVSNDIMAIGNVRVVSDTGITLFSEKLAYNQKTEKIYSDVEVMLITQKGDTLYGLGFESDKQLHVWRIKQPRGSSHKSVDLSGQQFRKPRPDSTSKPAPE